MMKFRKIKNSFSNEKAKYMHKITEEEAFERYLTKMLDEAIEEFQKDSTTIPFEEWQEEMRREYNVSF